MATAVLLPTGRPQPILGRVHPNNRRIRFAPLPDPRRSVLISDDGLELPFPQLGYVSQFNAPPTPSPSADSRTDYFTLDSASLSSSSSSSKLNSDLLDDSSPGTATPVSITTDASSVPPSPISEPPSPFVSLTTTKLTPPTPTKARPFQSFFRSLKRSSATSSSSSSTTLTPVPSIDRTQTPTFSRRNFSAEEFLTLGTINLFRPSSSREPHSQSAPSPSSSTWSLTSLTRWTSATSSHSHKEPSWGSPLARASSTQSYQSPSKASKPQPKKTLRPINRKGTRMLNGRVYGVKRNANPFANARDDEPTFVEWGYGGMGSVKGATSAGAHGWERLHGAAAAGVHSTQSPKDEDGDDGSGMAWIKKRREQREREKRHQEEKENALEKAESADLETPLPLPPVPTLILPSLERKESVTRLSSRPGTASSARTVLSNTSSLTVTPCPAFLSVPSTPATTPGSRPGTAVSSHSNSTVTPGDEQHLTRAITVPAPHRYHHRPHSRGGSKDLKDFPIAIPSSPETNTATSTTLTQPTLKDEKQVEKSESESESSDAEREDSSEDYEDDSEEEEEEEEEEQEARRKTALGAGVEKISRHH